MQKFGLGISPEHYRTLTKFLDEAPLAITELKQNTSEESKNHIAQKLQIFADLLMQSYQEANQALAKANQSI